MSEEKFVIYFGSDKKIQDKVSDAFVECKVVPFIQLQPTFDFLQSTYVEAIVFETYQSEKELGLNITDLDVLLFYATSESSMNRMIKFFPIDPILQPDTTEGQNIAEVIYEDLYEKYLFLMQGQMASSLSAEAIALPQGLDLIADLIGTLDDACENLDKNLESTRVSFHSEDDARSVNTTSLNENGDDSQLVKGGTEGFGEEDQLVKGQKKDLAEDALVIKGVGTNEEDAIVVNAYETEDDEAQRIAGSPEDLSESSTRVNGTREDLTEDSTLIGGSREDLTESSTMIKGSPDEEDEESTVIKGSAEDLKEEAIVVKSNHSEEKESKTVIKGSEEKVKKEFMKLKSLATKSSEDESDAPEVKGINQRNDLGQTPLMLFSKIGNFEKAEELVEKGADISLNCKEGKSVLHYACQNNNNFNLVKYLVEQKSAKIGKRDSSGKDPLFEAITSDSPEIIRFLLDQGARMTTKIEGNTYLHIAAQKNKLQAFKVLLTYGANIQATNDKGLTVAQYCKSKKKINFLKVMEAVKRLKQREAS